MNLWYLMTEQCYEGRDSAQLPRLRLHGVVHVAEVLQVGRRVSLAGKSHRWQGGSAGKHLSLKTFLL